MEEDFERPGLKKRRSCRKKEYGPLWSPIFVPLLFIAGALSIPYGLVLVTYWKWRERRFAGQMMALGRVISFDKVKTEAEGGKGTIICEWRSRFNGPVRHWWTQDDVLALSLYPWVDRVATASEKPRADFNLWRYKTPARFRKWCYQQYINPTDGKGLFFVVTRPQTRSIDTFAEMVRKIDVRTFAKEGW